MPDEPTQSVELLTARQLAARLQVELKTVWALTKDKRIPVIRLSPRIVRYDPVAVLEAITRSSDAGDVRAVRPHKR